MTNININVTGGVIDQHEIDTYIARARSQHPESILSGISINVDGDYVDLTYHWITPMFGRLRRLGDILSRRIAL